LSANFDIAVFNSTVLTQGLHTKVKHGKFV